MQMYLIEKLVTLYLFVIENDTETLLVDFCACC